MISLNRPIRLAHTAVQFIISGIQGANVKPQDSHILGGSDVALGGELVGFMINLSGGLSEKVPIFSIYTSKTQKANKT